MVIQHNMLAMNTNRQLGISVKAGQKSTEKLSSGYRINRAGDDAAGLAISEKMRSQIRGLNKASANSQDGISLIQTAEGALNETQNILQRMRELAVQAANGTNTDSDRNEIQKEINQLTSEINRIANTTEFNTMKLLKGNTNKAEIGNVTTDTLKEAVIGVQGGTISDLSIDKKSTIGESSTATIVGNKAAATGSVSPVAIGTEGVKAQKATATLEGITFKASGDALNGVSVQIVIIGENGTEGISSGEIGTANGNTIGGTGVLTIGIKKSTLDSVSKDGEITKQNLYMIVKNISEKGSGVKLSDATGGGITAIGTPTAFKMSGIDLVSPTNEDSGDTISIATKVGENVGGSSSFSAAVTEKLGSYSFNIKDAFDESGDTITILGHTFKAGTENSVATNTFKIFSGTSVASISTQASNLKTMLESVKDINDKFTITANGDLITIAEKATYGGSFNEMNGKSVSVSGGGKDSYLEITTEKGANGLVFQFEKSSTGPLKAELASGNIVKITLGAKAGDNTAAKIEAAIQELGKQTLDLPKDNNTSAKDETEKVEIDFSKITVKAEGSWDTDTDGYANIATATSGKISVGGGVREKKGEYSFSITNPLSEGDQITIAGQKFTAKKGGSASKGEIDVSETDVLVQAANLAKALKANAEIKAKYDVKADNGKIILTEKEASGVDLDIKDVSIAATGTTGEFKVNLDEILKDGASIDIDGKKIEVSSKNQHVGYENGTAIKLADSLKNQAAALADAINKNKDMDYTAKTDDEGNLVLMQKSAKQESPVISTSSSTKGTFDVTFQVGANTGQSMTIAIGDTRSAALGVSSDGSEMSIMPDNGVEAFYTENQVVTDGTTNTNIEHALDISSYEKATAAIGAIDDALSIISAQRSQLGAYQNRLEHTIANLDNTSENLQSAESRIRDVDMAKEMSEFSKNNILQQAAQSMLAQANQSTQGVLTLLR